MKILNKAISIVTIVIFCTVTVFFGRLLCSESYNPLFPDIDTYYTPKFEEKKFFLINPGMDTSEVVKLIGHPFSKQKLNDSSKLWYYTGDGKCKWMDFAWIGREIEICSNKVVRLNCPTHYD
jgi:hypothetical protein